MHMYIYLCAFSSVQLEQKKCIHSRNSKFILKRMMNNCQIVSLKGVGRLIFPSSLFWLLVHFLSINNARTLQNQQQPELWLYQPLFQFTYLLCLSFFNTTFITLLANFSQWYLRLPKYCFPFEKCAQLYNISHNFSRRSPMQTYFGSCGAHHAAVVKQVVKHTRCFDYDDDGAVKCQI